MIFKQPVQAIFTVVRQFFRAMNFSQNVKPSTSLSAEKGKKERFPIDEIQPTLRPELSTDQDATLIAVSVVEQYPKEKNDEAATSEASTLPIVPPDDAGNEHWPAIVLTQEVDKEGNAQGAAMPILDTTSLGGEKDWIELGGEQLPLTTVLESLLFVADSPVMPIQLAKVLNLEINRIEGGLQALAQMYQTEARGLRLQERDGTFLLITTPAVATIIEDFLNLDTNAKLSGPALETLAVIAYRQPITRMQIEAVRGIDSTGVLRSLMQRGLVEEVGRLDMAGRPFLYGVTDLFLQHFGLTKIEDLPPLQSSEADTLWATTKLAEISELAG